MMILVSVMLCGTACNSNTRPNTYGWSKTGTSARDILTADKYTRMVVEIQHMPGYKLDSLTLINIKDFLSSNCTKPSGIEIVQSEIHPSEKTDTLSLDQVIALERKYCKLYTAGHTLVIHILVTNGYDERGMIAGLAYLNTSIVVYGKAIEGAYMGNEQQSFVLEHELGHLMGLVNSGNPVQQPHEDTVHLNHCNNPNCTMYFASGRTELDSNCLRDIAAIKARN